MSKSKHNTADGFILKSRVYPVLILLLPIFVLGITFSFKFESYVHLLSSLGLIGVLSFLFSQIGRDFGRRKETALWEAWGGMPSVQLLRWRDNRIDPLTKLRYHRKLHIKYPAGSTVDEKSEADRSDKADEVYQYWSRCLVSKTRGRKKFDILQKESVSYHFRRNLWGLKPYAIFFIVFSMFFLVSFYFFPGQSTLKISLFPLFIAEIVLCGLLSFWVFLINGSWVKVVAFAYAERLLEASGQL